MFLTSRQLIVQYSNNVLSKSHKLEQELEYYDQFCNEHFTEDKFTATLDQDLCTNPPKIDWENGMLKMEMLKEQHQWTRIDQNLTTMVDITTDKKLKISLPDYFDEVIYHFNLWSYH